MELFLYKCELCGVAMFATSDRGRVWYVDCCGICKTWTYYEKVVHCVLGSGKESHFGFYGPTAEEYKNGISEKDGNTKEEHIDEHRP